MNRKTVQLFWADDDEDDLHLIQSCLADLEFDAQCRFFNNGMELVNFLHIASEPPTFVVLDLNMPLVDGGDTLNLMKQQNMFQEIPVIIYSTSENPRDIIRVKHGGAAEYLIKPGSYKKYLTPSGMLF